MVRVRAKGKLALSLGLLFWYTVNMTKSIKVHQKKRGRPATGRDPAVTIRLPQDVLDAVDAWSSKQDSQPARSPAISRLVAIGLATGVTRHFEVNGFGKRTGRELFLKPKGTAPGAMDGCRWSKDSKFNPGEELTMASGFRQVLENVFRKGFEIVERKTN